MSQQNQAYRQARAIQPGEQVTISGQRITVAQVLPNDVRTVRIVATDGRQIIFPADQFLEVHPPAQPAGPFGQTPQFAPARPKKKRTALKIIAGAVAAMIGLGIVASLADDPATTPATTPEPKSTADEPPATPDEPAEETAEDAVAQIGTDDWFEWENGLKVQVTRAEKFTLGEFAMNGSQGETGVIVTVTVRNDTGKTFDTSLMEVNLAYGPNGDQAEREYDKPGFTGSIPPGGTKTAGFDFAVVPDEHTDELLIEVTPDWEYNSAFFQGGVN